MKNNKSLNFNEEKNKTKLKKHIIVGIIFVVLLLILKISIIPKLKEKENNNKVSIAVDYQKDTDVLNLKIKIKSDLKEVLGKSKLEIYLDNELVENNMIYVDNKDFRVYTKLEYRNEKKLRIVLNSENNKNIYFNKNLKAED